MCLFDAFKYNSTLTSLDLSKNLIGQHPENTLLLAELLTHNTTLINLDLSDILLGRPNGNAPHLIRALECNITLAILSLGENNFKNDEAKLLSPLLLNPNRLLITSSKEKTNTLKQADAVANIKIAAYGYFWQYLKDPEKEIKRDLASLACCHLGLYALKYYWQLNALDTNKKLLSKITSETSLTYCFTKNDTVKEFICCCIEIPNDLVKLLLDALLKVLYVDMVKSNVVVEPV